MQDNYLASGTALFMNAGNLNVTSSGNTFVGALNAVNFTPNVSDRVYSQSSPPNETRVFVRPNQYQVGRGNIVVYNWPKANSVSANLSTLGLSQGQAFEIRDVQNWHGPAAVIGTYNAANPVVSLPMTLTSIDPVLGNLTPPAGSIAGVVLPTHTSKEFGVFVVLPSPPVVHLVDLPPDDPGLPTYQ